MSGHLIGPCGVAPAAAVVGGTYATWNPADVTNGALSGSNLIFTQTSAVATGGTRIITGQGVGTKYFFEVAFNATTRGADTYVGISLAGVSPTTIANTVVGAAALFTSGTVWMNGSPALPSATAAWTTGAVTVGCLVDSAGNISFELSSGALSAGVDFTSMGAGPYYPVVGFHANSLGSATGHFDPASWAYANPGGNSSGWPL